MKKNVFLMILFTCFFVIFSYELSIKGIDFNNSLDLIYLLLSIISLIIVLGFIIDFKNKKN